MLCYANVHNSAHSLFPLHQKPSVLHVLAQVESLSRDPDAAVQYGVRYALEQVRGCAVLDTGAICAVLAPLAVAQLLCSATYG
jgi:hypothetical protein